MSAKVISKVLEIDNCPKEDLIKALYNARIWEEISPVSKIEASFTAPNVLFTKITDNIKIVNVPVNMEGELVLSDKGEEEGKGRLIEFNVRNNKDVKELEGNLRIKSLSEKKSKVGVFVHKFVLSSDFLKLFGSAAELTLRTKVTEMLRGLEKFCNNNNIAELVS
ncbi:MAG: hypothetical protein ACFFAO_00865 [Candidatus Hermodarchaeota archaeon]